MDDAVLQRLRQGQGFIAALDQSGGSTPQTLQRYGIAADAYATEAAMFDLVHAMRVRVMTAPCFTGARILGAILFEQTLEREVAGKPTVKYLQDKGIPSFVKVDQGLADAQHGVRLMRPMPGLDALATRARERGVVGTKMRSVILQADAGGISAVVQEQLEYAKRIAAHGLVPIVEPEVDLHCPDRPHAEQLLRARLLEALGAWKSTLPVMLKLTIPAVDNTYADLAGHANVLRVVALSGGYSQEEACRRLAHNRGLIASFSRALLEGLTAQLDDTRFNQVLEASIARIFAASTHTA